MKRLACYIQGGQRSQAGHTPASRAHEQARECTIATHAKLQRPAVFVVVNTFSRGSRDGKTSIRRWTVDSTFHFYIQEEIIQENNTGCFYLGTFEQDLWNYIYNNYIDIDIEDCSSRNICFFFVKLKMRLTKLLSWNFLLTLHFILSLASLLYFNLPKWETTFL